MGFDVLSKANLNEYGEHGFITEQGLPITIRSKIASLKESIAWAEEQLALTRAWRSDGKDCFAKPDDWISILDEFEADLESLTAIATERKVAA